MTAKDNKSGTETPEQKASSAARAMAEQQAQSSNGGILESIAGFLKFLWESFFPSKDAPDEDPAKPSKPVSAMEIARLGKVIIDKQAIPNWRKFQEEHDGSKVEHTNPVAGGFREITRDKGAHKHPVHGDMRNHDGVDLKPRSANPDILASADGVVLFAGEKSGYGNTVILGHADGSWTLYAHMRDKVDENMIGTKVAREQVIGVMGASGVGTGVHLHYEQGKGDKRITPRIAEVGDLVAGVGYAADKSNPMAALVGRNEHGKFPVKADAKVAAGRPITVAATKPGANHSHE